VTRTVLGDVLLVLMAVILSDSGFELAAFTGGLIETKFKSLQFLFEFDWSSFMLLSSLRKINCKCLLLETF